MQGFIKFEGLFLRTGESPHVRTFGNKTLNVGLRSLGDLLRHTALLGPHALQADRKRARDEMAKREKDLEERNKDIEALTDKVNL